MANSVTITAFDNAGTAFPITIMIPAAYIGNPNAAQLKASLIVTSITMANLGMYPPYTPRMRFPFTAVQRMAGNPPRPDTLVTIRGTRRITFGPDNTGEALNRLGPNRDGVLISLAFGGTGTGTGTNASGAESVVNAGIGGEFIASVSPFSEEPFREVLDQLAVDLNDNKVPATVDMTTGLLTIFGDISGDQTFAFGNTDTGFSDFATATQIPEPSAVMLIGTFGLASVAFFRGRGSLPRG